LKKSVCLKILSLISAAAAALALLCALTVTGSGFLDVSNIARAAFFAAAAIFAISAFAAWRLSARR